MVAAMEDLLVSFWQEFPGPQPFTTMLAFPSVSVIACMSYFVQVTTEVKM